jgi:ATP-dependent Clp protease adaptor protein ClpS
MGHQTRGASHTSPDGPAHGVTAPASDRSDNRHAPIGAWCRSDFCSGWPSGRQIICGGMTATFVEEETKTATAFDTPWNVVVHNDPVNLMTYVTRVFQKVFGYAREKAEHHMLEVHQQGRSIVWTGRREPAEAYVQQLHGYLLLATLERTE